MSSKKRAPGLYWYINDWMGDECVRRCDYAAKGLWFDFLMLMQSTTPPGVLPGDLVEVARLQGLRGEVAKAWAARVHPLVRELEDAVVFSRGGEMPGSLRPDAIVSRRIYRHWLKSANAKASAQKRWGGLKPEKPLCETDAHPHARPHATPHARPHAEHDARPHAEPDAESMRPGDGVSLDEPDGSDDTGAVLGMRPGCEGGMPEGMRNGCISNSYSNSNSLIRSKSGDPDANMKAEGGGRVSPVSPGRNGTVESVGTTAKRMMMQTYINQLVSLTGDESFQKAGWMKRILAIAGASECAADMEILFDRLEKDTQPHLARARGNECIQAPAAFATAELMRLEKLATGEGGAG